MPGEASGTVDRTHLRRLVREARWDHDVYGYGPTVVVDVPFGLLGRADGESGRSEVLQERLTRRCRVELPRVHAKRRFPAGTSSSPAVAVDETVLKDFFVPASLQVAGIGKT